MVLDLELRSQRITIGLAFFFINLLKNLKPSELEPLELASEILGQVLRPTVAYIFLDL